DARELRLRAAHAERSVRPASVPRVCTPATRALIALPPGAARSVAQGMIAGVSGALPPRGVARPHAPRRRSHPISYMLAKAIEPEKSVDAEDEANAVYARAHNGIHDVKIDNPGKEILKERGNVQTILHNWRIVFFSIAGVSLLIGGVGIFSVLKISVGERLFEIGLRKSMGATNIEIFGQFLIESVTLSPVGAAIGLAGGLALVRVISDFF